MKIFLFMVVLISLAPPLFAGVSSGVGKITMLNMNTSGNRVRIEFSKTIQNPNNCGAADFYIVEFQSEGAGSKFYSTLLAAHLAQKEVKFWIDGCSQSQWWGYTRPRPIDIYVLQ